MEEEKEVVVAPRPEFSQIEKEYQRKVTVVEAIPLAKRIGFIVWAVIDIALLTIFLGYIGWYLAVGSFTEKGQIGRIGSNVAALREVSLSRAAQPLSAENTVVFTPSEASYDFYSVVQNDNEDWYARFSYAFQIADGEVGPFKGFVLPNEERPIVALGESLERRPTGNELILSKVEWYRVDAGEITDVRGWVEERLNFEISNVTHGAGEDGVAAVSRFTIKNATPYSYWTPEFLLLVQTGSSVTGINVVTLSGFESGETREVEVKWFGSAPPSGSLRIVPNIDVFDAEVYMSPSGKIENTGVGDRRL